MASSYNINNLYPKPGIFNNTPLTASTLTSTQYWAVETYLKNRYGL